MEARYVARHFAGADLDRLRNRPVYPNLGPVTENRQARDKLLYAARELDRNNSWAHGALNAIVDNVVGDGIRFESRIQTGTGRLLERQNREVERRFNSWAESVDSTGRLTFFELQQLVERELWAAGEVLVVRSTPNARGERGEVPLVIDLVESERLAGIDEEGRNTRTLQGVEMRADGRPTAYHIYPSHPADGIGAVGPERIPADRVLHLFHSRRPNQVRGLSRLAPVARNFEAVAQFLDFELTKARTASAFALMIKRGGLGLSPKFPSAGVGSATTDANDNPIGHLEGGMIMYGGPSDSIESAGASIQSSGFEEFMLVNLRAIATGLNISYEVLNRDFTKTNFSSARQSSLEDRRHWVPRQRHLIAHFCNPVFRWFTDAAILAGIPSFAPGGREPSPSWVTPVRDYVDPAKELQADIDAVAAGFVDIAKISAKHGCDVHEVIKSNSQIKDEAEEVGLTLKPFEASVTPPPEAPPMPTLTEETEALAANG